MNVVVNLNTTVLWQLFNLLLLLVVPVGLVLVVGYLLVARTRSKNRRKGVPGIDRDEIQRFACPRCSADLECLGVEKFRTSGATGVTKPVSDERTELGKQVLPLEVWICPNCRKVEFRLPPGD